MQRARLLRSILLSRATAICQSVDDERENLHWKVLPTWRIFVSRACWYVQRLQAASFRGLLRCAQALFFAEQVVELRRCELEESEFYLAPSVDVPPYPL